MNRPAKWLKWRGILLLAALTPTCRQIVQLASRAQEQPLAPWTGLRLRVHLRICRACQRYLQQLDFLKEAATSSIDKSPTLARHRLPPEAKGRLKRRLRCERVG